MSDLDRDEIRRIIREVISELPSASKSPSPEGPRRGKADSMVRVLFLFNAGVRRLDEALEQVRLIEETGAKTSVYTGPSARGWLCGGDVRDTAGSRCILDTVGPEGVEKVLQRADVVVLPTLCLTVAAKVAGLTCDEQESKLVFSALIQGKKVLAARDGFLVCDALANDRIREEIDAVLDKLESFGMVLSPTSGMSQTFQQIAFSGANPDKTSFTAGEPGKAKRLITAKVINDAVNHRQDTVTLDSGGITTPLARDLAKEYGVRILKRPRP